MSSNRSFSPLQRDKAAHLLGLLVRWANYEALAQADYDESLGDDDFLTEEEGNQLKGKGKLTWQGKDSRAPELTVQAEKKAIAELCSLPQRGIPLIEKDIQTILNDYFRDFLDILIDHRKLAADGKTRESPHFTLKLWSRSVEPNITQMQQLWDEKRKELEAKGGLSERQTANSSPGSDLDPKTLPAQDTADSPQTVEVTPMPPDGDSQIIPTMPMPFSRSPVLDHFGEYGWKQLYEDLLEAFAKTDEFEAMLEVHVGENPEVLSSPKKPHGNRVLDTVKRLNREGRVVALVRGALQANPRSPSLQRWRDWLRPYLEDGGV